MHYSRITVLLSRKYSRLVASAAVIFREWYIIKTTEISEKQQLNNNTIELGILNRILFTVWSMALVKMAGDGGE